MKLLFDQNISFRIVNIIQDFFPKSQQVRTVGLENCSDLKIWDYAKSNNYTLVTFDADFYDLLLLNGFPPKIIWLRFGNTSTKKIAQILLTNKGSIKEFSLKSEFGCLEISNQ